MFAAPQLHNTSQFCYEFIIGCSFLFACFLFRKEIILDVDSSAKELILQKGYEPKFGARPLRRAIEKHIQNPIASLVIRGEAKKHCKIKVSAQNSEFKVTAENI